MKKRTEPTQADFDKAKALADQLKEEFPSEFTLTARLSVNGHPLFPNLHFKADPDVPGLYEAKVDPNIIMGRSRESGKIIVQSDKNGNGNQK